jgi:hypothetical protein
MIMLCEFTHAVMIFATDFCPRIENDLSNPKSDRSATRRTMLPTNEWHAEMFPLVVWL